MLRWLTKVTRPRARTVAIVLAAGIVLASLGLHAYGVYQWRAARKSLDRDRPDEARRQLAVCLLVWPSDPDVHLLAARAARQTADFAAAESHLGRCLKLSGGATEATQLEFLLMRVQQGEVDEVAPALAAHVEEGHPESPLLLKTLAQAYMHQLRYRPAYAALSRWIDVTPDSPTPFHWRGWVQERMNQPMLAMRDYERALELGPDLAEVRLHVAELLLQGYKLDEALSQLEQLRAQFSERADVLALLGRCRLLQNEPGEARRLMETAVKRLPDDVPLLLALARLDLQERQPAAAEERLRHALQVDPTHTEAYFALATALRRQERHQEAEVTLKEYEKYGALLDRSNLLLKQEALHPTNNPDTYAEIGTLLLRLGNEQLGLYWLSEALSRDPGHQASHRALVEHFENSGAAERAAAHRRRLTAAPTKAAP